MCQYDPLCDVGRHKPQTVCPRTGRSGGYVPTEPIAFTEPMVKKTAPLGEGGQPDDLHPWTNSAVCVAVLFGMWLLASAKTGGTVTLWVVLVGVLLVAIPAGIASGLLYRCHAWLNDGTRRCRKPRKGFMMRCRHHQGQMVVAYDVAALIAGAVMFVNGLLGFWVLVRASEFDFTPLFVGMGG
ncbi:Uncharacterised protein [Mycobacteroides abscessus subsp. abscessus]|nr:Uncharacterised protein [Mycobacteroides abscessus subsp. abscessus]SKF37766.1 Uncharacterised protein [Mycobacteroides abscessus subsp. abscessus]